MHVNKQSKEGKKMIQEGFEAPGMAKSKETQICIEENKI